MALDNYVLEFDGVDDFVQIPQNSNLPAGSESRTIEFWASTSDYDITLYYGNSQGDEQFALGFFNEVLSLYYFGGGVTGTTSINKNQLYHVAVTISQDDTIKLYLDGEIEAQTTKKLQTADSDLHLKHNPNTGNFDGGKIDEIRVWDYERSQSEIQNNMNDSLAGNETGLVAYYPADEGAGNTLYDRSQNNNDGTINGAVWLIGVKISGNVTLDGTAVQDAKVLLINSDDESVYAVALTDASGYYEFSELPASTYHAIVEYEDANGKYNAKSLPFLNS